MARVTLTELYDAEVAQAADYNSTLSSWRSSYNAIRAHNVRDEGLDRRNFVDGVCHPDLTGAGKRFAEGADIAHSVSSAPSWGSPGQAPLYTGSAYFVIGPFNWVAADSLIVRCATAWNMNAYHTGSASYKDLYFSIGWSTDWNGSTGTWTHARRSQRRFAYRCAGWDGSAHIYAPAKGDLGVSTAFNPTADGASEPGASDDIYFGLFGWETVNGVFHTDNTRFFCRQRRT